MVSKAPKVTHTLAGRDQCLVCHDPAGQMKPAPTNHKDFSNAQCTLCHKAGA